MDQNLNDIPKLDKPNLNDLNKNLEDKSSKIGLKFISNLNDKLDSKASKLNNEEQKSLKKQSSDLPESGPIDLDNLIDSPKKQIKIINSESSKIYNEKSEQQIKTDKKIADQKPTDQKIADQTNDKTEMPEKQEIVKLNSFIKVLISNHLKNKNMNFDGYLPKDQFQSNISSTKQMSSKNSAIPKNQPSLNPKDNVRKETIKRSDKRIKKDLIRSNRKNQQKSSKKKIADCKRFISCLSIFLFIFILVILTFYIFILGEEEQIPKSKPSESVLQASESID